MHAARLASTTGHEEQQQEAGRAGGRGWHDVSQPLPATGTRPAHMAHGGVLLGAPACCR